jgi:1-phosphofructokinase family hexose kinase
VILATGLTPAWQQIMCFPRLEPGEVNRAREVHWCASGKVLNVGLALQDLGAANHTLAPAGGWAGAALRAAFTAPATWIPTTAISRVCTTVLDEQAGVTTELVENAAPLGDLELADFTAKFDELARRTSMIVLTGSLPAGTPTTFYRSLLDRSARPVVLDARGPELLAALPRRPRVVKPNRDELASTLGRPLPDRASVLTAMSELIERGAQAVVVTSGNAAVQVMEGKDHWELPTPSVTPIVNPIGCGDCLAAGLALGLSRGETLVNSVRFGMAAAAENLTQLLPARLSRRRVDALAATIHVS